MFSNKKKEQATIETSSSKRKQSLPTPEDDPVVSLYASNVKKDPAPVTSSPKFSGKSSANLMPTPSPTSTPDSMSSRKSTPNNRTLPTEWIKSSNDTTQPSSSSSSVSPNTSLNNLNRSQSDGALAVEPNTVSATNSVSTASIATTNATTTTTTTTTLGSSSSPSSSSSNINGNSNSSNSISNSNTSISTAEAARKQSTSNSSLNSASTPSFPTARKSEGSVRGTIGRLFGKQAQKLIGQDDSSYSSSSSSFSSSSSSSSQSVKLPDISNETAALEQKLFSIALFIGANSDTKNELTVYKDRHWTEYMKKEVIDAMNKKEKKQQEVIWELFVSELSYIDHLLIMKEIFLTALRELQEDDYCKEIDTQRLFGNIEVLLKVNMAFASEMKPTDHTKDDSTEGTITVAKVGEAFSKFGEKFDPYNEYCVHYAKAVEYLKTLEVDPRFDMLRKWCESRPRCRRLKLTDILVEPLQRVVRYPLLIREVAKTTVEEPANNEILAVVMENVEKFIGNMNKLVKARENEEKIASIQSQLEWPVLSEDIPDIPLCKDLVAEKHSMNLTDSPRFLVHAGKLQRWSSSKPVKMEVFLFQDMLLLTKLKRDKYVVKRSPIPTQRISVKEIPDGAGGLKSAFFIVYVDTFGISVESFTFIAENEQSRKLWLTSLYSVVSPELNNSEAIALALAKAAEAEKQPPVI